MNRRMVRGPLCQPQKYREHPINRQRGVCVEPPDGGPELRTLDGLRTIDGDLGPNAKALAFGWRDIDSCYCGIKQSAGQRQDDHGR
jgi:hypothetical protein